MLNRVEEGATIPATLAIVGQGTTVNFNVTYRNVRAPDFAALVATSDDAEDKAANRVLSLIAEWEADYPLTVEGLKDMEADRPGITTVIVVGFYKAKRVAAEKN